MFLKISAVAALVSFTSAFVLETPSGWESGGPANISWAVSAGDPARFSVELTNPDVFHNSYAIANNIDSSLGFLALTLPTVDIGAGYYVEAVNVSNINDVYASSGEFTVAQGPSTTSSSSSTSSAASSSASSSVPLTSSGSAASSASGSSASTASSASHTGVSSTGSSATSAAPSASVSTFNGSSSGTAARFDFSFASVAVMVIGAIAGAVIAL